MKTFEIKLTVKVNDNFKGLDPEMISEANVEMAISEWIESNVNDIPMIVTAIGATQV